MTGKELKFFDRLFWFCFGVTLAIAFMALGDHINIIKVLS